MRTLGHNHAYQHTHNGNLRCRAEKEVERILVEIIAKNFPSFVKYTNLHIQEVSKLQECKCKEIHRETHYNQTVKNQGQKGNLETSKGQATHHSYKGSSIILTQIMGATRE